MVKFDFVIAPSELADAMIEDLGNGGTSINGDRTSSYFLVAKETEGDGEVNASLIENKAFLSPEEQFYSVHLIDDISMADCELLCTERLDRQELVDTIGEMYESIKVNLE